MTPDIAAELQKEAGELVRWASQVYVYSIVCHFREILRSTVTLYDAGQVAAVFLCVRSLFEMAAHIYYGRNTCSHTWTRKTGMRLGNSW